jgi:hypothetical protein
MDLFDIVLQVQVPKMHFTLGKTRENKNENEKTNELEVQEFATIHPLKCLYGGIQKTKLPLLNN